MFRIEWTAHEPKPQAELDELYGELLESIEIDGPHEFSVLVCAAQILETRYAVARVLGYSDHEPLLEYADVVELFVSLDAALEAMDAHRAGVLELYPGSRSAEHIVFDAARERVRLFRVPWLEAVALNVSDSLPQHIVECPEAVRGRDDLVGHLRGLRREFACATIACEPRLSAHEPLQRWSRDPSSGRRTVPHHSAT